MAVSEACCQHGIRDQANFRWRAIYGGMEVSEAKRLKALDEENLKLKRLVADLSLDNVALKDALAGKYTRP